MVGYVKCIWVIELCYNIIEYLMIKKLIFLMIVRVILFEKVFGV